MKYEMKAGRMRVVRSHNENGAQNDWFNSKKRSGTLIGVLVDLMYGTGWISTRSLLGRISDRRPYDSIRMARMLTVKGELSRSRA